MAKGAQAKAAKADAQAKKEADKSAAKEREEEEKWSKGAKGKNKNEDKAEKAAQAAAKKAEAARLLAEEEASIKPAKQPAAATKKASAAKQAPAKKVPTSLDAEPTSFSATGIDDALDALTLATENTSDKAALGSKAAQAVDLHPERRFKAAFEAYKDNNLAQMKKDYPGLRLQQYHDRLYKEFQKSPDNPFNQVTMAYNTTKSEKVAALQAVRNETAERLRDD